MMIICSTEETESLLLTLDASEATGPDNISARMRKETATSIAPSLGKLFNLSISKGYFPHIWKNARVVPIPKSSPAGHASSSYRPISLLSVQSEVLEKHIHFLITEHLNEFHPLSAVQWGFQKGKSILAALLSSTHDWLTELDRNKDVCCVFFDFQKAFDTVPHGNLIKRLEDINLHPLLLKWTSSYLMNRSQHVVVNGSVSSESTTVISGVLQGSVLGPLLFLIYIDSITSVPLSEGSKISLYADDMMLYKPISSSVDLTNLQKNVDSIFEWSCSNFMVFNVTKCKSMLLSHKRNVTTPTLTLDGCPLDFVKEYKYLGILISTDLSWKRHIEGICVKVKKLVGTLYRKFSLYPNPYTMARLYVSQIRPHLEYGAQVCHPHLATDTAALEKVQKFALRICSRSWSSSYGDLLELFKLQSLEHRRIYLSLCLFL